VREIAGDLAEDVRLVDEFTHPKTQRRSVCYRINYRSMDRTLTNEEIDQLQRRLRERLPAAFGVELR
jgi:phenylalanyl-tRNA synthetase alpha chain